VASDDERMAEAATEALEELLFNSDHGDDALLDIADSGASPRARTSRSTDEDLSFIEDDDDLDDADDADDEEDSADWDWDDSEDDDDDWGDDADEEEDSFDDEDDEDDMDLDDIDLDR
jgi:hypothetical protein